MICHDLLSINTDPLPAKKKEVTLRQGEMRITMTAAGITS